MKALQIENTVKLKIVSINEVKKPSVKSNDILVEAAIRKHLDALGQYNRF
jgi:hypothetical protein